MRGFEVVSAYKDLGIEIPVRKTKASAGYDLATIEEVLIKAHEVKLVKTGLKAFMAQDEVLYLMARSSLASGKKRIVNGKEVKTYITLANSVGVIDSDYYNNPDNEGHIMCLLYNFGDDDIVLNKGERVCQAIFSKYLAITNEEEVTETRQGGFGSTGK